jgi:hypothetical protein
MSATDPYALADPIARPFPPERVNYATGVLLQAEDFRDEQSYHRGRLAMALRHLVGFGTLAGLRVKAPAASDNELELHVEPGLAIDRHGRLIELREPYCIRLSRWFAAQTAADLKAAIHLKPATPFDAAVVADVFLSARDCGRGKTPSFAAGPFDALDALVPARLAEEPDLEMVLRKEGPAVIPEPANRWPAPNANRDTKLAAVLGSWDLGLFGGADDSIEPLAEHVATAELSAVLLARIAIPVTPPPNSPPGLAPTLDLAQRTRADNSLRPFIFLPGKWLGRAPVPAPLVEP